MIRAVKTFLDNPHTTGALLITGKWGSGKTYFVKNILAVDGSIADEYAFVFVSLFGADGVEDINKKVKSAYFQIKGALNNSSLKNSKILKSAKKHGDLLSGLASIIKEAEILEGLPGAVLNAFTTNWKDFAPIENVVNFDDEAGQKQKRRVVLVLDDLERYISVAPAERVHQVLGIINEYTENQDFKTIVLADEDKITDESKKDNPYHEIKEKAIAQTLSFSTDYYNVFDAIIDEYKERMDYKKFLLVQKNRIIDAFLDIGEKNIRSLINAFALFHTVYNELIENDVADEDVRGFFFNFLDVFFYSRNGKLDMNLMEKQDYDLNLSFLLAVQNGANDVNSETTEDERQQKQLANDKYFLKSLLDYIALGQWSAEALSQEINEFLEKKYPKPKMELSAKDKILSGWQLLTIDENSILDGFQSAVDEAYNANLELHEFINIISADYALKSWGVEHYNIDWDRFDKGITDAIVKIEANDEFDSEQFERRGFITDDTLRKMSEGANHAYAIIDKYNPAVRKNRYMLIKALRSQDIGGICSTTQHKIFEEFDNELADAFGRCYSNTVLPDDKRELFISFKNVACQVTTIYNEGTKNEDIRCKDIPNTIIAFKELKSNIESLCSDKEKPMTAVISKSFVEEINKHIKILETRESLSSNEND